MKVFIFLAILIYGVTTSVLEDQEIKFQSFKLKYSKSYRNQAEETKRFNIFKDNLQSIEEHNTLYKEGFVSYKKGVNKFTDMSLEEFKAMLTLNSSNRPNFKATHKHINTGLAIPDSVDWRTQGQVTEVKDQGFCGSCWAFSLTGSTEAAYYRRFKKLVSLSEQQLVDCSTDINHGCSGGYLEESFPYIEENGLEAEDSYPYVGVEGGCRYSAADVVAKVSDYKIIEPKNEADLLDAVANIGPVSVALDATYLSSYESGIYDNNSCSQDQLNHAVLVVGYGTENGKDFWIVKNSWNTSFGENGYFRILRGQNECGIAKDTVYPTCG